MGIDKQALRFLAEARERGADFSRSAMIGRQFLWVDAALLSRVLRRHDFDLDATAAQRLIEEELGFAEPLFRLLGARRVESIDYAAYEGATISHDMNQPIGEELKGRFSVVYDGGSLEHIFDFPTSIRNCMEMLEVGGHFLSSAPANNQAGHGFYQFSPELFFRIFSLDNGFELERLVIYEERSTNIWYEVRDPDEIGARVTLCNCNPTWLLVQARRVAEGPVLSRTPQQSDYAAAWRRHASPDGRSASASLHPLHEGTPYHRLVARIPPLAKRWIQAGLSFFRPFDPAKYRRLKKRD
jgi:hypothetical protein